jgi:hypothetical protein
VADRRSSTPRHGSLMEAPAAAIVPANDLQLPSRSSNYGRNRHPTVS